jgi:hypothetical protein
MEKLFFEVVDKDASGGNQKIEKKMLKIFWANVQNSFAVI